MGGQKFPPPPLLELLLDLGSDILDKHPGSATLVPVVGFNVFATLLLLFGIFFLIFYKCLKFCGELEFYFFSNCPTIENRSVADPDPGSSAFLTPGSGTYPAREKIWDPLG
jgi:hypothetical protein